MAEHADEWFDLRGVPDSPFMMYAVKVLPDKAPLIPAITHVDGTGRLQTVRKEYNPRYYRLIETFGQATGVPIVLNTSAAPQTAALIARLVRVVRRRVMVMAVSRF